MSGWVEVILKIRDRVCWFISYLQKRDVFTTYTYIGVITQLLSTKYQQDIPVIDNVYFIGSYVAMMNRTK